MYQSGSQTSSLVIARRYRTHMSEHAYKSVHYEDGWLEIREDGNPEGWIATDDPAWIEL